VITPVSSTADIVLRPVIIYTQTVMRGTDSVSLVIPDAAGVVAAFLGANGANMTDLLTATGFSTHTANNVRDAILDDATRFSGANIDASISSRSSHTAANVWAVGTRTLTSFGSLIADIWASVSRTLTAIPTGGATEAKQNTAQSDLDKITDADGVIIGAAGATKIIDEFETQSQADPTGFQVNLKEINGTGVAGDGSTTPWGPA